MDIVGYKIVFIIKIVVHIGFICNCVICVYSEPVIDHNPS